MTISCRSLTCVRGQSAVEFALILPLLLLIVFGLFDLSYAVFIQNMLANGAREGARVGIILHSTDTAIQSRVNAATPGLNPNIVILPNPGERKFNAPITVTVSYTYTPLTPLVGSLAGGLQLSSTSVMNIEGVILTSP